MLSISNLSGKELGKTVEGWRVGKGRIQNTEDRRQRTEYRRQKTEYRRQEIRREEEKETKF